MSRIQDILARAERDGTARRTQPSPTLVPPPAPEFTPQEYGGPAIDGTSALDPSPFIQVKEPAVPVATPIAAPVAAAVAPPVGPAVAEGRAAHAILHAALVAAIAPHSAVAEQYRAIRTRITQHEEHAPLRTVMITSPGGNEGKSITAANLALTMAQEIQRQVVLVDADLRGPSVHALFGLDASGPGLSEVLAGEATLDEALVYLPDFRLTVLPAGGAPKFPTELLGSAAMRRTLDTLRARFDRVLLDLPAVMPLADVGTVAPLADGVVMVVRAGATQRPALDQALAALEDSKILGVVLNEVH
jgi:capsular exopolysaccharide synthesis family protein